MTISQNVPRHDGPKCGARKKQGEGTCTQAAGWGTNHPGVGACKLHSGSTRTGDKTAARISAQLTLAALAGDAEPVANPLTALSELAGEVLRWKRIMSGIVAELERLRYEGVAGTEQIDGRVLLFERALDRCANTLALIARLNIDDRLAKVSERQADTVITAIESALTAAGVRDPGLREEGKMAAARHLKAV